LDIFSRLFKKLPVAVKIRLPASVLKGTYA
jgi:hypothetical protein